MDRKKWTLIKIIWQLYQVAKKQPLKTEVGNIQEFNLYGRAHHVFSEAHRVWEFKLVCETKSGKVILYR